MITMSSKRPVAAAVATGLLATRSRRVPLAVAAILGTMTGARTIAGGRGGHCPLARGEDGKEERKEEDEIAEDGKRVEDEDGKRVEEEDGKRVEEEDGKRVEEEDGKRVEEEDERKEEDGKRVEEHEKGGKRVDKVDGKEEEHEEEGMKLVFSLYEERKLTRSVSTPPK